LTGPILLDTGPIVAILSESDEHHEVCVEALRGIRGLLTTCWPVVVEAAWLLRAYPRAVARLLASFDGRFLALASLGEDDLPEIAGILAKYRSLGIQLADASLVHLANRLGIDTIFTLDRRDFGVIRPAGRRRFRMIP
jgi:predicted nucleic acid-binding protein